MPDSPAGAAGLDAGSAVALSSRSSAMLSSVYRLRAGPWGARTLQDACRPRLAPRHDSVTLAIGPQLVKRRPRNAGDGVGRRGGWHAVREHDHHVAAPWSVDDARIVAGVRQLAPLVRQLRPPGQTRRPPGVGLLALEQ